MNNIIPAEHIGGMWINAYIWENIFKQVRSLHLIEYIACSSNSGVIGNKDITIRLNNIEIEGYNQ